MITINNHKQQALFDPWAFLSPKRRRLLDEGWPGLFRTQILPELPVGEISPFFSSDWGRPSKELYGLLGALLLQQAMDLTDEQAVEQFCFDIRWHYALDITQESDAAKYLCPKTLWSARQLVIENNLEPLVFERSCQKLATLFGVDTERQRLDSVHIFSNMRRLSRIGIFSRAIRKFLRNLKRQHAERFEAIEAPLRERYLGEKALSAFSRVKPTVAEKTLWQLSADLLALIEQFKATPAVCEMHSYKLMQRVLSEHCAIEAAGEDVRLKLKPAAEVPSDSLQNPSDPDATYDGHKGQGYQVQVMETYTTTEDPAQKQQTLNLITHVAVEPAHVSDTHALLPALEDTQARGLSPKSALADAAYGSDDNVNRAQALGVEVVAPSMKGNTTKAVDLSAFCFEDSGCVISCPLGRAPVKITHKHKKDRYVACFAIQCCRPCPQLTDCPVKPGKKYYYLRYHGKEHRLAQRRRFERTEEFIDRYRWRAGIEATMSEYATLTGVKRLRVRGMAAVRYCAILKAAGLNLMRAARVQRARMKARLRAAAAASQRLRLHLLAFKERFAGLIPKSAGFSLPNQAQADDGLALPA
jgi:Transposase DDE domain/Transposase domain (DUF772)